MPTLETAEKKAIKEYLGYTGWFFYHNLAGLGVYPGIPDLTAIKNGKVLQIEIKAGKGVQSEKQEEFMADWVSSGGFYYCGNLDGLIKYIQENIK